LGTPTPLVDGHHYNTRAITLHNPLLDIWQFLHLSDGDYQIGIWRKGKETPIITISVYWEIRSPTIPPTLAKAIT